MARSRVVFLLVMVVALIGGGASAATDMTSATDENTWTAGMPEILEIKAAADRLSTQIAQHLQEIAVLKATRLKLGTSYFSEIDRMDAGLKSGAAPGNPDLTAAWQRAWTQLGALSDDDNRLDILVLALTGDASVCAKLESDARGIGIAAPIGDSDRDALKSLAAQIDKLEQQISRGFFDAEPDLIYQSMTFVVQPRTLAILANAIALGQPPREKVVNLAMTSSLLTKLLTSATPLPVTALPTENTAETKVAAPPTPAAAVAPQNANVGDASPAGRMLLTFPTDSDRAAYERGLYAVVADFLTRNPKGRLTVDTALPIGGDPTRPAVAIGQAERESAGVIQTLNDFGVPPDRVTETLSHPADAQDSEIRIFGN